MRSTIQPLHCGEGRYQDITPTGKNVNRRPKGNAAGVWQSRAGYALAGQREMVYVPVEDVKSRYFMLFKVVALAMMHSSPAPEIYWTCCRQIQDTQHAT
jgi:hypothetical protein